MAFENTQMYDFDSSNIRQAGYDEDDQVMYVKFYKKNTGEESVYWYAGVYPDIWESFLAAPSKGQFMWSYIRGQYEYGRLF